MPILLSSIAVVAIVTMLLIKLMNSKKPDEMNVRYPVAFHTVDVAVVKTDHNNEITHVLLIQKPHEVEQGIWRFPGGFIDPTDNSAEEAATREVGEETKMKTGAPVYIGSTKIDDARYRESPHKIITSFFWTPWISGEAGKGYDDVAVTKWFDAQELLDEKVKENPTHDPLFKMMRALLRDNN